MAQFELTRLEELSFSHALIEEFDFSSEEKKLEIKFDGLFTTCVGKRMELIEPKLTAKNWSTLQIRSWNSDKEGWKSVNAEPLETVCEIKVEPRQFCLRGFGEETGHWVEYAFFDADVQMEYEVMKEYIE